MVDPNTVIWLNSFLGGRSLWLAKTERGLCRLEIGEESKEMFLDSIAKTYPGYKVAAGSADEFLPYLNQLEMYFCGVRVAFDLPLDLIGTGFQLAVWQALREIPYGTTRTYGEVAAAVGRPRAYRAVGGACHSNPVLLFIPCHRVIGSDGSLVGFGSGLELKKELLELENRVIADSVFSGVRTGDKV